MAKDLNVKLPSLNLKKASLVLYGLHILVVIIRGYKLSDKKLPLEYYQVQMNLLVQHPIIRKKLKRQWKYDPQTRKSYTSLHYPYIYIYIYELT